jgi:hypothetical protein
MTRVLASDQVKKGADGLKPLFPPTREPIVDHAGTATPYIPTEAEMREHVREQPGIAYAEEQAAADAADRKRVEALGFGATR